MLMSDPAIHVQIGGYARANRLCEMVARKKIASAVPGARCPLVVRWKIRFIDDLYGFIPRFSHGSRHTRNRCLSPCRLFSITPLLPWILT